MHSGYLIGICSDNKVRVHEDKAKKLTFEYDTSP
jgi:hypothetical protein